MTRPGNQWIFSWVCLSTLIAVFCPLDHHAQQSAIGSAQPAQAAPGADANGNSGNSGRELSGLTVVVKVASIAGDRLLHADGYRIRVQSRTVTAFSGSLKLWPTWCPAPGSILREYATITECSSPAKQSSSLLDRANHLRRWARGKLSTPRIISLLPATAFLTLTGTLSAPH